jgi:hypothetical protein
MVGDMIRIVGLVLGLVTASMGDAATSIQLYIQNPHSQWLQTVYIDKGKVIVQSPNDDERVALLYDQGKNQFTFINHSNQSYLVLEMETFERLAEALDTVSLANLAGKRSSFAKRYLQTDEQRSINGYHCNISRISKNGLLDAELCLAGSEALQMPLGDYRTLKAMLVMAGDIIEKTEELPYEWTTLLPDLGTKQFEGLPVLVSHTDRRMTVMLRKISKCTFVPEKLSIPAGYRQADLMELLTSGS